MPDSGMTDTEPTCQALDPTLNIPCGFPNPPAAATVNGRTGLVCALHARIASNAGQTVSWTRKP